ncbi:MAG TPA: putative porin [Pyrinomonadaceae bacterium]|nr:putative porin [Pyrinomonadaceae bacterium]
MLIAQKRKFVLSLFFVTMSAFVLSAPRVLAQSVSQNSGHRAESVKVDRVESPVPVTENTTSARVVSSNEERLAALERALDQQNEKLDQLHKIILDQQNTIQLLTRSGTHLPPANISEDARATLQPVNQAQVKGPVLTVEERLKKVEGRVADIGPVKFSGDLRLRSESFFGLSNSLANGDNPAVLGNELSARHRLRVRARLAMTGAAGNEFEWGIRMATGSFADNISTNQTLTDFYNRKPFGIDQAYVTYKPRGVAGLRLQGGKFETPWTATEMTIDSDLMIEGINESYTRTFKNSKLKELKLVAWQSPFLERNSAFVRNSNGTVNIEQSRRGGRDLALYGGQIRSTFALGPKVGLTLSVADLFFSGTQFISPVQVWGSQLQLPVTFTIPASGSTPAQTITTQVSISRDLLVAGANLGLTNASNNATNRDGRLSSGFNLVDLLARLEVKQSKRWPVTVILNFVTNTQTRDVVTAGPGGADLILPNHENNGFWGEVQIGQTKARGDMQLGYTFMRIEKDAVLTPFNMSDITQQSDMRGHRLGFSYAADPRVTFTVTGIITQRPNGLLGAFGTTPPGSSNLPTKRLQFDTVLKF